LGNFGKGSDPSGRGGLVLRPIIWVVNLCTADKMGIQRGPSSRKFKVTEERKGVRRIARAVVKGIKIKKGLTGVKGRLWIVERKKKSPFQTGNCITRTNVLGRKIILEPRPSTGPAEYKHQRIGENSQKW